MTGKELIKAIVAHTPAPRIGYDFAGMSDICYVPAARFLDDPARAPLRRWGREAALTERVPGFAGEVSEDAFGNLYGRFDGKTKGECIRGVLEDGWDSPAPFVLPAFDPAYTAELRAVAARTDAYLVGMSPLAVFATLRDARSMPNALMDCLLEPERVAAFLGRVTEAIEEIIAALAEAGADAVILYDDWGTQGSTFIGPEAFRAVFLPAYCRVADAAHRHGLAFILHSCGYIDAFLEDFVGAGVDVFQFDQIELYGCEYLARKFGSRVAFLSPVDVQAVLPTGERVYIEEKARAMVDSFKTYAHGALIVKDYPSYADIDVREEWAAWARDVVLADSAME